MSVNTGLVLQEVIRDYVHGDIVIHPLIGQIVRSEFFQRLKNVKQMSTIGFIHPTLRHTRFEHCIGTYQIARTLVEHLAKSHHDITPVDSLCVQIAALCHDLGHGPFSHMFEKLINAKINPNFKHEVMSKIIFGHIFRSLESSFREHGLLDIDKSFIIELISPEVIPELQTIDLESPESIQQLDSLDEKLHKSFGRGLRKAFLFEIVSNYANGADVDKWDYLTRDSQLVRACMKVECPVFDFPSLLRSARIVSREQQAGRPVTHLAFCRDQVYNIYRMYELRSKLIQLTINDPPSLAIREILSSILSHLCGWLNMAEVFGTLFDKCARDENDQDALSKLLESYLQMDDRILDKLRESASQCEKVQMAKTLLQKLDEREFLVKTDANIISHLDEKHAKDFVDKVLFYD